MAGNYRRGPRKGQYVKAAGAGRRTQMTIFVVAAGLGRGRGRATCHAAGRRGKVKRPSESNGFN